MMFDKAVPDKSSTMDTTTTDCTYSQHPATADCCTMPVAVPVSPCTSGESPAPSSDAAISSNSGKFSDIQDKYHIDPRVLGKGFHGSVREITDRATGQRYAVKTIRKSDPGVKRSGLAREIMLLKEMKHHNIVRLVDVYEDAEYLHLVTDLFKGGELFDKIVEKSSNSTNGVPCFAEDEAATIIYQLLKAVSYMHKRGVVHRDIKPENIMFETQEENSPVKVIDLGLARTHFEGQGPPLRTIAGTPYYIAPEVLRKNYTKSCDLWSTGVVAYILLCGYPPFNGSTNDETHRSVLKGRYHFASGEWKGVSREAKDFIRRLLQTDPTNRMSAAEALNHPWMVRHTNTNVLAKANEEFMAKGLRISRRGSMLSGRVTRRNVRKAMFGI